MRVDLAELGKAYKAFLTYNLHARKDRLGSFELKRWLRVVKALNGHGANGHARPHKAAVKGRNKS